MAGKVVAIYTGAALVQPGREAMAELLPGVNVVSVLDDSLIAEVIENGHMTKAVIRRLYGYVEAAQAQGASVVLETCSSVGEAVPLLQSCFDVPIVRIDRPMIEAAVAQHLRIGVMATLATTLEPTMRQVQAVAAENHRDVAVVSGLSDGAFQALTAGDGATHDELLLEMAKEISDQCDAIVLAQGSMARMEETLSEVTGKPVYSSLRRGIEALRPYLQAS